MKFRVVSQKDVLDTIKYDTKIIYFVFRDEQCSPNFKEMEEKFRSGFNVFFDLRSSNDIIIEIKKDIVNRKPFTFIAQTGCKWCSPPEFYLTINARSGISYKTPLRIANNVGIVEPTYRNDIGVLFDYSSLFICNYNIEYDMMRITSKEIVIKSGMRIAQAIIQPNVVNINEIVKNATNYEIWVTVDKELYDNFHNIAPSDRGMGGFGSTDNK